MTATLLKAGLAAMLAVQDQGKGVLRIKGALTLIPSNNVLSNPIPILVTTNPEMAPIRRVRGTAQATVRGRHKSKPLPQENRDVEQRRSLYHHPRQMAAAPEKNLGDFFSRPG